MPFYIISYDVKDNRRRLKLSKLLKDYGERVQHSVFEARLDPAEMEKLEEEISKIIDSEEDSCRLYSICEACVGRIEIIGQGVITEYPEFIIV